jgi:hypothetical protein
VVLLGALGGLHPVKNIVAVPRLLFVQVLYALVLDLSRRHAVSPSGTLAPEVRGKLLRKMDQKTQKRPRC